MSARDLAARMDAALDGGGLFGAVASVLGLMEIADEEIEQAQRRHRGQADTLWHSFRLLTPTGHMSELAEFVYRGHVRELLGRVVAGQDTRPGTAAEIALACRAASEVAPLTTQAAGLYARAWRLAGFPGAQWDDSAEHYEALYPSQIDDLERDARHKTRQDDRRLGGIECGGRHHGRDVICQYARPAAPVQLELIAS